MNRHVVEHLSSALLCNLPFMCRTHNWVRSICGRTKGPQNVPRSVAVPNKEACKAFRVCTSVVLEWPI